MRLLVLAVVFACSSPQSAPQPQSTPNDREPDSPVTIDPGTSVTTTPAAPADAGIDARATPVRTCPAKPNPKGCPAAEPNVNASCAKLGLPCEYGASCCKPTYVCVKQGGQPRFEARFGCE